MRPDFSLLLVLLTGLSGLIWMFDALFFKRRRMDRAVQDKVEQPREPVIIEYSRSLFPILLIVLIVFFVLGLAIAYGRAMRRLEGIRRAELQFILFGASLGVLVVFILNLLLPVLVPEMVSQRFSPLGLIPMNLTIAYGIATRRLMNVSMLLQRIVAYTLLTVYLSALYLVVNLAVSLVLHPKFGPTQFVPHLVAALVVAFSMTPVHGIFQRISRKLFINVPATDVRKAARMASEVFASISTTDAMIGRFRDVVNQSGIDADARVDLEIQITLQQA